MDDRFDPRKRLDALKQRVRRDEETLADIAEHVEPLADVPGSLERIRRELEVARTIPSVPLRLRERAVEASVDHVLGDDHFADVMVANSKRGCLDAGLRAVSGPGVVAEFGVFRGTTLTRIARRFPERTVHGFDSFIGLPEDWAGTDKGAGAFDIGGQPPDLPVDNVAFHVGFFDATVPPFADAETGPFAFAHLDADLYSSTKTVFDHLGDWFVPGTVIVFDEYFGYHGWELHEHRAFMEFLDTSGHDYEAIALGHMNLAVQLVDA